MNKFDDEQEVELRENRNSELVKRIVVVASTYPRWNGDGVPMFVYDQLTAFHKSFPKLELITLVPHDEGAKLHESEVFGEVIRFRYFLPARLQKLVYPAILPNLHENRLLYLQVPFLLVGEFFALLKIVLREKPNIIYSHWFMPQGVIGGLVGLITGTQHVYTSHSSDVEIARRVPLLGSFLVRFFTRRAARVTVVSVRSSQKLKAFFSEAEWVALGNRVKIIPMGVDTSSFAADEARSNALRKRYECCGRRVLLFVGRLAEKKGVKYLLEAMEKYVEVDSTALLFIAGNGPLLESLEAKVKQLGLSDNVRFTGYTVGQDKLDLFAIADVLVLPSIITDDGDAEGFPVVLMEGLASGKICIATDVSGADDVIESGKDGFLVKQKDHQQILNALLEVKSLSRAEIRQISENAVARGRQLDWSRIARDHVEHLFKQ